MGLLSSLLALWPALRPTMAMAVTDTARGPLMPRPTTAQATAMVATATATARGPLMPRPTTTAQAMAMVATPTARGLLMPSPLPLLRPSPRLMPTTAMEVTALAMVATTARGPLMPRPTTT